MNTFNVSLSFIALLFSLVVAVDAQSSTDYFIGFDSNLDYVFLIASEIMDAWYTNTVYGEMWFHNDTAAGAITSISTQSVWVNLTGFNQSDDSSQTLRDVEFSNGALVVTEAGIYQIGLSLSFGNVGNNHEYQIAVAVNNRVQNQTDSHRKIGAAGDVGDITTSGTVYLSEGDIVTVFIRNNDGTVDAGTHAASLNIMKVGES
jgi:hypothetical protein